jgi:hypothetical protein
MGVIVAERRPLGHAFCESRVACRVFDPPLVDLEVGVAALSLSREATKRLHRRARHRQNNPRGRNIGSPVNSWAANPSICS